MDVFSIAFNFSNWSHWWFPGGSEFLNMISVAFWWIMAFAIAAIPAFIVYMIVVIWWSAANS